MNLSHAAALALVWGEKGVLTHEQPQNRLAARTVVDCSLREQITDQVERIHDHRADAIEHRAHSVGCGIGYRIRSVLGLLRRATWNDEERANNQKTRDNSVYFQHEKFSHR